MLKIKRIYDSPDPRDGYRILVDGLWPRGLRKEDAPVDEWLKEVAPSAGLRKWFGHEPGKWAEFVVNYRRELEEGKMEFVEKILAAAKKHGTVTLLFSTRDEAHNNAVALLGFLEDQNP